MAGPGARPASAGPAGAGPAGAGAAGPGPRPGARLAAPRPGAEDLGLDPLQRVFQDRAQVADHVLARGRGLHGHPAQVGGELDGQPLQVAQGPEVEPAGPAGPPAHPRPVLPAAPPGPVRPARSLAPPGPAGRIPVVAGAEAGAHGIAEPPGAHGLVTGAPGFLAEPPGLLVHAPRRPAAPP